MELGGVGLMRHCNGDGGCRMVPTVEPDPFPAQGDETMTLPDPEPIDVNQIRPSPIRHESLPDEFLETVHSIFQIIGPYLGTTLEQFELNFMRDMHPEQEVVIWACITAAWVDYHEQHLSGEMLADEEERKLIAALIAISSGVEDVEAMGVPADVGEKLLACYDALGDEPH